MTRIVLHFRNAVLQRDDEGDGRFLRHSQTLKRNLQLQDGPGRDLDIRAASKRHVRLGPGGQLRPHDAVDVADDDPPPFRL